MLGWVEMERVGVTFTSLALWRAYSIFDFLDIKYQLATIYMSCPYASSANKTAVDINTSDCPMFKNGCPFAKDLENLSKLIQSVPDSHLSSSTSTGAQFKSAVDRIHSTSTDQSSSDQFNLQCPFTAYLKKSNKSLVAELDSLSLWTKLFENLLPLSKQLKEGTKVSHKEAESVSFVKNFIRGKIVKKHYVQMQVSLYYVYEALEAAIDDNKEIFGKLYQPEKLRRLDCLNDDMVYFGGHDWKSNHPITPPTADYVARIKEISLSDPIRLVSHAYTRYLGDLSGGQILKKQAKKALSLPDNALTFYEFENIKEGAKVFKDEYRGFLDEMKMSEETTGRLIGEANVGE